MDPSQLTYQSRATLMRHQVASTEGKIGWLFATLFGVAAISGAALFTPVRSETAELSGGVRVSGDRIGLLRGLPGPELLQLQAADAAGEFYSQAVPARVRIDPSRASRIGSPLAGQVKRVYVELGQQVERGDRLFSVSSTELPKLRGELAKSRLELATAETAQRHIQSMLVLRLVPGRDLIEASARTRRAEIQRAAAEARLRSLRVQVQNDHEFVVTAPRRGVVVDKTLGPSQMIAAGDNLLQIADVSSLWLIGDVFEQDARTLRVGSIARVSVPSRPEAAFEATIESISMVNDASHHSVPVRLRAATPASELKPNQYLELRFRLELPSEAVEVADTALVSAGAQQFVWVEEAPGELVRRRVVVGPLQGGRAAIVDGLALGERVVVRGAGLLSNLLATQ